MKRQLLGSLLVAALIVATAMIIVTAKFGSTSAADRELREEQQEQQLERQEDQRDE